MQAERLALQGVCYVAYGASAVSEAQMSIRSLDHVEKRAIAVVGDPVGGGEQVAFADPGWGARWAKLNLDQLSPYDYTVYLDADTRVRQPLAPLFVLLADGFDLVLAPSGAQGERALWHVEEAERNRTLDAFGYTPLQLQAGFFAFRKSEAIADLFAAWREEYRSEATPQNDQAALLRALDRAPVKLWLISKAYSEWLVSHLFGKVRNP